MKSLIKKSFKNKAEMEHYMLSPRVIEETTTASGEHYHIFDYGNYIIGHIFEIYHYVTRWQAWESVSGLYTDYGEVSRELKRITNQ